MKNLINDVRRGKEIPLVPEPKKMDSWNRDHWRSAYHKTENIWPWTRVKRVCEAHIGKPFDTAFSEFYHQVRSRRLENSFK